MNLLRCKAIFLLQGNSLCAQKTFQLESMKAISATWMVLRRSLNETFDAGGMTYHRNNCRNNEIYIFEAFGSICEFTRVDNFIHTLLLATVIGLFGCATRNRIYLKSCWVCSSYTSICVILQGLYQCHEFKSDLSGEHKCDQRFFSYRPKILAFFCLSM